MNYIDIIIIALLAFAAIMGVWKGFIRQLFGLVALFLGIWCACHFSNYAAFYISKWIDKNETAVTMISFAVTFIVVLFGVVLVGRLAEQLVKVVMLGFLNRLMGLLFSVVKMALILSISIWLLQKIDRIWPFFPHHDSEKSVLFAPVAKFAPTVLPYLERLFAPEEEACSQRSDSAIADAASITTGVLKAKQASCLPPIENFSIFPVAKL